MSTQISLPSEPQPKVKRRIAPVYDRHIVVTPGVRGGKPRIIGRRITVSDIATWYLQQNRSVSELVEEFDLTHAQIHAALAYYYDHQAEIDEREAKDLAGVEALKFNYPSKLATKLSKRDCGASVSPR